MGNAVTWFEVGAADDRLLTAFYGKLFGWELRPAADGYTMVNTLLGAGINGGIGRSRTGEPWAAFYSRPTTRGPCSSGRSPLAPRSSCR